MVMTQFETVAQQAKTLTTAEQRRLLLLLENWLDVSLTTLTEQEFEQELLRDGVLDQVPAAVRDDVSFQNFKPVDVQGKPLSETIIEEHR